jgi:hypothetical protein
MKWPAASLASVWTSMTSLWLWNGQEEAISTLVAQASGAGNGRLAGAWLQLACGLAGGQDWRRRRLREE